MEALFLYFGKMILCSAVMFGYYHLALRNRTFHHYNRFYLLLIIVVSLTLPLLKVSYFTVEVNSHIYLLLNTLEYFNSSENLTNGNRYFKVVLAFSGMVSFLLLIRFLSGILKIQKFKRKFPKEEYEGISFYQTDLENAPFSFFRNLFWKNTIHLHSDLGRQILKHEMVHIEQKHTHDKIFMEMATGFFWFNPFFWLIKKELRLIHEYLADKKAVKQMDTKAFAHMLLASHFSGTVIPGTSPFLGSNLKKRLKMLQKPKTKFGYAHRILALPLVFTMAFAYAVNAENKEIIEINSGIERLMKDTKTISFQERSTKIQEKEEGGFFIPAVTVIKNDTIKKEVKQNDSKSKVTSFDPMPINLYSATDENLFIVEGKEVSRQNFIDYYLKYRNNKEHEFGNTALVYNEIWKSGKKALFTGGKIAKKEQEIQNIIQITGKYANTEFIVPASTEAKAKSLISKKDNPKELESFLKQAEKERLKEREFLQKQKMDIDRRIGNFVKSSKVKDNFYPGRNYSVNPLTPEEIAELKDEASKIMEISKQPIVNPRFTTAVFKTDLLKNFIFKADGELQKEETINFRNVIYPVYSEHTNYFINGKKVSKEKILQLTEDVTDADSFLKNASKIKEMKLEHVSDGTNSYLFKLELFTH